MPGISDLPLSERAARHRELAKMARELAASATQPNVKEAYDLVAERWEATAADAQMEAERARNAVCGSDAPAGRVARRPAYRAHRHAHRSLSDDLEFRDYGRDARFAPGWWILPGMIAGGLMTWAAVSFAG